VFFSCFFLGEFFLALAATYLLVRGLPPDGVIPNAFFPPFFFVCSNHTYMLVRGSPPDGVIPGNTVWEKLKHVLK